MNTKRIVKWVIVLFLLAALPGLTAVMAQEQEPAGKAPLPVVTEPGESQAPETYNRYESESNNTLAKADPVWMNDVMGGKIGSAGDVDYFLLDGYWRENYMVDVDAFSIGSSLDPVVCIYRDELQIACYDDNDTVDPLVYDDAPTEYFGDKYYISITDYYGRGGPDYYYELIVSDPLLVSAAAGGLGTGYVAGIPFRSEDILAHSDLNNGAEKWVMFFDGSDVGITKNLWNISLRYFDHWWKNHDLLIGLAASQTLPDVGMVTPFDIVRFEPEQYGPVTIGTFTLDRYHLYLAGRSWELTQASEKIDAFDSWGTCDGDAISTVGVATVLNEYYQQTRKAQDEDLLCREVEDDDYTPYDWDYFFDGSRVPGLKGEDVIATGRNGVQIYLTILGSGVIAGHRVTQKDIFAINYPAYTWGGIIWHGPDHGWNYNIDAFD